MFFALKFFLMASSILECGPVNDFSFPCAMHREQIVAAIDTSEAKQVWDDDNWGVESIFFDFDGDGYDEALTSTTSQSDRNGDAWSIWTTHADGRIYPMELDCTVSSNFSFTCHSSSFFILRESTNRVIVISLGMDAGIVDARRIGYIREMPDCSFGKSKSGMVKIDELVPGIETRFRDGNSISIERLYGESYGGFDFKPAKREYWFNFRSPKGDLRPGGGIVKPNGFDAFAAKLRREAAASVDVGPGSIRVFAVFLDADNDGDADAYVAFATDRTKGGNFRWTLYLNNEGGYSKAEAPVFPVPERRELCELAPSVVSPTNGFCRVVRFDVEPTFLILDGKGSPTKVRDAITNVLTHRIEKLPCIEIREE